MLDWFTEVIGSPRSALWKRAVNARCEWLQQKLRSRDVQLGSHEAARTQVRRTGPYCKYVTTRGLVILLAKIPGNTGNFEADAFFYSLNRCQHEQWFTSDILKVGRGTVPVGNGQSSDDNSVGQMSRKAQMCTRLEGALTVMLRRSDAY